MVPLNQLESIEEIGNAEVYKGSDKGSDKGSGKGSFKRNSRGTKIYTRK